ncbi:O-antigen ligase family protein [Pseudomonas rhodesiae]|uniref:O-antigen ligase family protein n=1 Tax=Pseudomonas rhodesiae TaxID=76760 RepID=UPI0032B10D26
MIKGFRYYYVLIFFVMFLSFFSLAENLFISIFFRWGFIFSLALCSLFFIIIFLDRSALRVMIWIYLLVGLIFVQYASAVFAGREEVVRSLENGLQFLFSMVVLYFSFSYSKKYDTRGVSGIALMLLLIAVFLLMYHVIERQLFFQNANSLGMIAYLMICSILFFRPRLTVWAWVFGVALILISESRSSLLGLLVFFTTYVVLPRLLRLRLSGVYFFSFVVATAVVLSFTVGILFPELNAEMNRLSREIFQKNLDSGRSSMWSMLFELMEGYEVWGRGGGVQVKDISSIEYSAHNLYLQIYMQLGLVGEFMLIALLYSIWNFSFNGRDVYKVRIAASAFIGLLVINCFEVTLFQNNLVLSLPILVLVGIAAGSRSPAND